ncbi:MAG: HD domain-containing protein [Acidobacteriota bacterium]
MTQDDFFIQPDRPLFSGLLESAARLATRGHFHQFRKRGREDPPCEPGRDPLDEECVPYVSHLVGVVGILARLGAGDEVLAAALLHDYLEDVPDGDGRRSIEQAVGTRVLRLVLEVTEDKRLDRDERETWDERKKEQIDHVAEMSDKAVLIKAADLLHNLGSMVHDLDRAAVPALVWDRFNAPPQRQLWYFRTLLGALSARLGEGHALCLELENLIARMTDLQPVA